MALELRKLSIKRYKGYSEQTDLELAPLTILVGANNSGKTALAQVIQLLAGGFDPVDRKASEPLPLESGGLRHGEVFRDLVTGQNVHGHLSLSASFADSRGELSISTTVSNVVLTDNRSVRQISDWQLKSGDEEIKVKRQGYESQAKYSVSPQRENHELQSIDWQGLLPREPSNLADWVGMRVNDIKDWAAGVRHLCCPRSLIQQPLNASKSTPVPFSSDGTFASLALATDDELKESVRKWYRDTFGASVEVETQGKYSELMVGTQHSSGMVQLMQSGQGLSHVLPVVVMALTANKEGVGVDVIEHPEAELHPAAHGQVADLLLNNLVGVARPMVIETHSEMMLLRARRWIAEEKLSAKDVLIYWIDKKSDHGSTVRKITINQTGDLDSWPEGVFIEGYEEILAIRRAIRRRTELRG